MDFNVESPWPMVPFHQETRLRPAVLHPRVTRPNHRRPTSKATMSVQRQAYRSW